jgi:shikimate kinase
MKTICLTGMMGSGKTTVAKIFASDNHFKVIDIDSIIEQNEHCEISEIFKTKGEEYFRKIEQQTITDNFKPENSVISLGGGAFENERVREFLLKNSTVVYLKTSPAVIFERIKNDTTRPLLHGKMNTETIAEILNKREKNYLSAHKTIITDGKTPQQIVLELEND